jgi:glycerol-3-phosphate acyltransferase PlsX
MDDAPGAALRRTKDSSLRLAFELVRNDQADAVVTMGNSGAALAMGMFVTGRLEGVLRPAIAALIPHQDTPVVLLDVGATIECKPEHLVQFAAMGAALSKAAFGSIRPKVGLLSNGEEEDKGTETTRAAAKILRADSSIHFAGNVEPSAILVGDTQVVVTDGWTGNIALKTAEAVVDHMAGLVGHAARDGALAKAGALLMGPSIRKSMSHLSGGEAAGGLLLGIDACAVIGHGRADASTVAAAIRLAAQLAEGKLLDGISDTLELGASHADG